MDAITSARSTETSVLIVDDELHARKLLAIMLGEGGVRCKTAACAEEALRILDREPLDAMLVDLQMPQISGMELLIKLRPLFPSLAFLMVTGVDDIRVGIEAMKNGCRRLPRQAIAVGGGPCESRTGPEKEASGRGRSKVRSTRNTGTTTAKPHGPARSPKPPAVSMCGLGRARASAPIYSG